MTYKDILDTVIADSGDQGANYRANAILWLNLARQESVLRGSWKSAKNSESSLLTDANTTGIYVLAGIDEVIGGQMYDTTANSVIERDTENTLMRMQVRPIVYGPPVYWADSGMTTAGDKQIRFWPIPDDVRTINYIGSKGLTDITASDEMLTVDPYFGSLSGVGSMLQAGLRYYHDVNNNEDVGTIGRSQGTFYKAILLASGQSGIDNNSSTRMHPVNRRGGYSASGRFDPGHYGNR